MNQKNRTIDLSFAYGSEVDRQLNKLDIVQYDAIDAAAAGTVDANAQTQRTLTSLFIGRRDVIGLVATADREYAGSNTPAGGDEDPGNGSAAG